MAENAILAPSDAPLTIALLVLPQASILEVASALDPLRNANRQLGHEAFRWRIVSPDGAPVPLTCGLSLPSNGPLAAAMGAQALFVIAGYRLDQSATRPLIRELRRIAPRFQMVGGVDAGPWVMARAGLLNGYRACVSWFHHDDYLEAFEGLLPVSDQIFVVDRDRLTCSGGVSSAQLAAFLVDRHIGSAAARKALAIMIVDEAMGPEKPQPGLPLELTTHDELVKRALLVVQQSIDAPLTVAKLAERLAVSRRRLERHFMAALGLGPQEAGRKVRFAHARNLLQNTDRTVSQIAAESGFADASHLIRAFRAEFGATPEVWRLRNQVPASAA